LNDGLRVNVPLVLMNSFNTEEDTQKVITKYSYSDVTFHCFNQSRYPRIYKDTLQMMPNSFHGNKEDW